MKPLAIENKAYERAKAFDTLRNNKYPVDPHFRWVCMDTRIMHPTEMTTSHLFNALKMLWNNLVPTECIIQPFTSYHGVKHIPKPQRKAAITNLYNELMNRVDRTKGMDDALARMGEHLKKYGENLLQRCN